jgi:serine/threonine-protein kinase
MTEPTTDGGAGTETPPPSTPAEERAKRRWWVWLILVLLLLVLLVWLLAYCVNQDSKKDTSDGNTTPTPTAVVTTASSGSSPTASPTSASPSPSATSESPSPSPTPTVATAQVPNVVGKDATTATSTLTGTGFTKVTCVDAEGATVPASDTLIVTKQDPAAGQTVAVDTEIKLTCTPKTNGRG